MYEYEIETMYNNDTVKEYVEAQKSLLKDEIDKLGINRKPHLSVFQVGNDHSSNSYVKGKIKDCNEVGIICHHYHLDEDTTEEELLEFIEIENKDFFVDGIIVQLPLPKHIDEKKIQLAIAPTKDVDGFHPMSKFKPCTPKGVIDFLKAQNYDFKGKNAVVVGRSDIVGKPLAQMLTDLNATVTLCHSKTNHLNHFLIYADISFTCINQIEFFDYTNFSDDVIDIGLGIGKDNKLHGNIKKESVNKLRTDGINVVSGIGGVGLLTRLTLLKNTFDAYKNN